MNLLMRYCHVGMIVLGCAGLGLSLGLYLDDGLMRGLWNLTLKWVALPAFLFWTWFVSGPYAAKYDIRSSLPLDGAGRPNPTGPKFYAIAAGCGAFFALMTMLAAFFPLALINGSFGEQREKVYEVVLEKKQDCRASSSHKSCQRYFHFRHADGSLEKVKVDHREFGEGAEGAPYFLVYRTGALGLRYKAALEKR